jgi:ketosteroid isomerase-like protein
MTTEANALADALGKAIKDRDVDQIRALYAEDIVVWHGSTGVGQSKDENANLLGNVFAVTSELEYRDIVRHDIENGVVQQHKLTGKFDNGKPTPELLACLIIKTANGKITRIDEYFDSPAFAEMWERLEALNAEQAV